MIFVICGLIGAGKTTFAKANFGKVLDADEMESKDAQFEEMQRLYAEGKDFAYITCLPTWRERQFLNARRQNVTFIWLDTDEETAHQRILERNRERDILNMWQVLRKNKELLVQKRRLHIDFVTVNSGDKWEEVRG